MDSSQQQTLAGLLLCDCTNWEEAGVENTVGE